MRRSRTNRCNNWIWNNWCIGRRFVWEWIEMFKNEKKIRKQFTTLFEMATKANGLHWILPKFQLHRLRRGCFFIFGSFCCLFFCIAGWFFTSILMLRLISKKTCNLLSCSLALSDHMEIVCTCVYVYVFVWQTTLYTLYTVVRSVSCMWLCELLKWIPHSVVSIDTLAFGADKAKHLNTGQRVGIHTWVENI